MSLAISIVVAALVVVAIAAIAHYRYWVRRLTVPLEYVHEERIETPDGSAFELRRLPRLHETSSGEVVATAASVASTPPVLLVHGIAIDHRNNDMLPDLSLARHLATEGRDCWLLTLRSGRADARLRERRLMRFEPMARFDLPMAIARVLERTGAPSLDYVGFSMGGMLLYGSIGRTVDASAIRRVVIIGSPAIVRPPWPLALFAWLHFLPWWSVPTVPLRLASRMVAFVADAFPHTPLHRWVYNPDNVERGIAGASLMTIQDVPAALSLDFARWARRGGPIDALGGSIVDRLGAMAQPILFYAGAADRIAPPAAVRAAFDAWGSATDGSVDKTFVVLGRAHGQRSDYGHGDLAIGRDARADLFEPIARFLAR